MPSENLALCYDQHDQQIKAGDTVRVTTLGSLNGEYTVIAGDDGALYFEYWLDIDDSPKKAPARFRELVWGFYPHTLEIVSGAEQ